MAVLHQTVVLDHHPLLLDLHPRLLAHELAWVSAVVIVFESRWKQELEERLCRCVNMRLSVRKLRIVHGVTSVARRRVLEDVLADLVH